MTCSYRDPLPNELTLEEISALAATLHDLGLRHIAYSGGEPLLRRDVDRICEVFARYGVKQTLLTNGLLLEKRFEEIKDYFHEIIVSIDGADAETHNRIRGLRSFDQIVKGVQLAADKGSLSIRTVIQKRNFRQLPEMIRIFRSLGVQRISFLTADVLSEGFGRNARGPAAPNQEITLSRDEAHEFRTLVQSVFREFREEFETGFVTESHARMQHLVEYYEALAGAGPFPRTRCNAPMVSAVITSTGDLQPCYFLPAFGNIRQRPLPDLLKSPVLRSTRNDVRAYALERCHTCVCTLHVSPAAALFDRF
jgi:MoaA/NifB/PqqE/SkfB family radical SAM enzyme